MSRDLGVQPEMYHCSESAEYLSPLLTISPFKVSQNVYIESAKITRHFNVWTVVCDLMPSEGYMVRLSRKAEALGRCFQGIHSLSQPTQSDCKPPI